MLRAKMVLKPSAAFKSGISSGTLSGETVAFLGAFASAPDNDAGAFKFESRSLFVSSTQRRQ
jgi:hypothetical protein